MKKILPIVMVVGCAAILYAQTENPRSQPAHESAPITLTGCLQQEDSGTYSLTEEASVPASKGKTYRLTASGGVDLKAHVGHKVQLTGSKGARAGKDPTAKGVAEDPSMLKVTSVQMVSATCATGK